MIGVKSKAEKIVGRFDGKDYVFEKGVTVALSDEAATHIFGYGMDDKSRALIRLGWLANSTGLETAMARMDNVQFLSEAKTVFNEEPAPIEKNLISTPSGGTMKIPEFSKQKN